jgi:hypothetical protein
MIHVQVIQMPFSDIFSLVILNTVSQFVQTTLLDKLILFPWYCQDN